MWSTVEVPAPGLEPGTDPTTNRQLFPLSYAGL